MGRMPRRARAATRRHVARCMSKVLSLAVYPGRHLAASHDPARVDAEAERIPKSSKAKACLYPEEDAKLMGCTAVAIERRLAYGTLAREGMRASEPRRLQWRDIDLERGRVRLDENKTSDPRAWALSADVVRTLEWWKKKTGGEPDDLSSWVSISVTAPGGLPRRRRVRPDPARVVDQPMRRPAHGRRHSLRALRAIQVTATHPAARPARDVRHGIARERQDGAVGHRPHRSQVEPDARSVHPPGADLVEDLSWGSSDPSTSSCPRCLAPSHPPVRRTGLRRAPKWVRGTGGAVEATPRLASDWPASGGPSGTRTLVSGISQIGPACRLLFSSLGFRRIPTLRSESSGCPPESRPVSPNRPSSWRLFWRRCACWSAPVAVVVNPTLAWRS